MKSRIIPSILAAVLPPAVLLLAAGPDCARAQHKMPYGVDATGGESLNGQHRVYDVVGQTITGVTAGPSLTHHAGYIPVVRKYLFNSLTAVSITAFTAEVRGDRVLLAWTPGPSRGLLGYRVYRSELTDDEFADIGGGLLPPETGAAFEDTDILPGTEYFYRVSAVDNDGEFFSLTVSIITPVWKTDLRQNRPNPFNPATTISFYLAAAADVTLTIYDARGKLVRTLADEPRGSGETSFVWNGRNDGGETVSSGIYFYRLRAGKEVFTKKMTLLK